MNQSEIVFDYNGYPMAIEAGTITIMDDITALVRSVREKYKQMGLTRILPPPLFMFKMSGHLWEGICNLCACRVPDDLSWASIEKLESKAAELRAELSIFVEGTRYPVKIDETIRNDIFFVPQSRGIVRNYSMFAVLRNVGITGGLDHNEWKPI